MFETVVIATDGSDSGKRAVTVALDIAARFDATVHALSVVDNETTTREDPEAAITEIDERSDHEVVTAIREGEPAAEICDYAQSVDADVIATGTRGRHGDHAVLLGSVAEAVVRECPIPVLTVRQLDAGEQPGPS